MLTKKATYNPKLKAFTITEIVIVLAISSIVTGLAFSVINVIKKNTLNIEKNYTDNEQINILVLALQVDFNKHTSIEWSNANDELKFISPIHTNTYYFNKDSIYTNNQTFKVKTTEKNFFFKGESVNTGKIDALKINFGTKNCFLYKNLDTSIHF